MTQYNINTVYLQIISNNCFAWSQLDLLQIYIMMAFSLTTNLGKRGVSTPIAMIYDPALSRGLDHCLSYLLVRYPNRACLRGNQIIGPFMETVEVGEHLGENKFTSLLIPIILLNIFNVKI